MTTSSYWRRRNHTLKSLQVHEKLLSKTSMSSFLFVPPLSCSFLVHGRKRLWKKQRVLKHFLLHHLRKINLYGMSLPETTFSRSTWSFNRSAMSNVLIKMEKDYENVFKHSLHSHFSFSFIFILLVGEAQKIDRTMEKL